MKLLICIFALVATAISESTEERFRSSSEQFTLNFLQKVAETKPGESFVVSTFSVLSPLAQLALASVGETHDEILETIGLPNDNAVEKKTNHRIKDLVSPNSLDASTAVVLVNAIYYKGKWTKPFEKKQTQDQHFHVTKDKTIKVPTMHKFESLRNGESKELDAKLLELPYKGDQLSLLIVLPNAIDGITALVDKLKDPSALSKSVNEMRVNDVEVQLPKFKIETKIDLRPLLERVRTMFPNVFYLFCLVVWNR